MKQKVLRQDGASITLSMLYNKGNQMTSMKSPLGKIGYAYDKNGNLVTKQMGDKRDTYAYDVQDRLTAFVGCDGFEQRYRYDAMGLRASMEQKGDGNRLTLEERLQGKKPEADAAAPDVDEWVKTSYI